ncbi:MAG: peptidylprolyl isomerase, partial [Pseudomonadota bacterium]
MTGLTRHLLAVFLTVAALGAPAMAQSPFSPAIRVNDAAITNFELTQRARLLSVLGATSGVNQLARDRLIEERLQQQAAQQLGITATEEEVDVG